MRLCYQIQKVALNESGSTICTQGEPEKKFFMFFFIKSPVVRIEQQSKQWKNY